MIYWCNIAIISWMVVQIFSIQENSVAACNGYSDFCDDSEEALEEWRTLEEHWNFESDIGRRTNDTNEDDVFETMKLSENGSMPTESGPLIRETRSFKPYRSEKELSLQITTILDELLFDSGYDRQIRPQIDQIEHGPPIEVLPYCIWGHI